MHSIELSREDWLALHRTPGVITASQVPTILGLNKWCSPFTLFQQFRGRVPWPDESIAMMMGHAAEPVIDKLYRRATGRDTSDLGDYAVVQHPDPSLDWLYCTTDRLIHDPQRKEPGVLELKHSGMWIWPDGEAPPLDYQAQIQIQMDICGVQWGSLAMVYSNRSFRYCDVEINPAFVAATKTAIRQFRDRVLNDEPPAVDGTESTTGALKCLYPYDSGEVVQWAGLGEVAICLAAVEVEKKVVLEREAELKNQIRAVMRDGTIIEGSGYSFSNRAQTRAGYLRVPAELRDRLTASAIKFTETEPSEYRVLRQMKQKGE